MSDAEFWEQEAKRHCGNEAYYRGLVVRIGEVIGKPAFTCDSGDVSQDVLCDKVPETVEAAISAGAEMAEVIKHAIRTVECASIDARTGEELPWYRHAKRVLSLWESKTDQNLAAQLMSGSSQGGANGTANGVPH